MRGESRARATSMSALPSEVWDSSDGMEKYINAFIADSTGERVATFMAQIRPRVFQLIGGDEAEKLQALRIAELLIRLVNGENSSILVPLLANIIRGTLSDESAEVLVESARQLGQLALKQDVLMISETVDFQLKRAMEWLDNGYGFRRLAAVLVIRELSQSAGSHVFKRCDAYFESVWTSLRDPSEEIHNVAAETLGGVLDLVLERGSHAHFDRLLKEALAGLEEAAHVHGSLLALGQLFCARQPVLPFLEANFPATCARVLRLQRAKKHHRAVLKLLPVLCAFSPSLFAPSLAHTMKLLLEKIRKGKDISFALKTLGDMLVAAGASAASYLPVVANVAATTLRGEKASAALYHADAVLCVGRMAEAGGENMVPFLLGAGLLSRCFERGFCAELVEAARSVVLHVQSVRHRTVMWLLDMVCLVVCDTRFRPFGAAADAVLPRVPFYHRAKQQHVADAGDNALKLLGLRTLREFPFGGELQLVHLAEKVLRFLEARETPLRTEGLRTCLSLLERAGEKARERSGIAAVTHRVVERVVLTAAADSSLAVRKLALELFATQPLFDEYLARPRNIKVLLLLVTDEDFEIRCTITEVLGRLAPLNPAYVKPAMRHLLVTLIKELEFVAERPALQMAAATLASTFLGSGAPRDIIRPYVSAILGAAEAQLGHANNRLVATMLDLVANLSRVGGDELLPFVEGLVPRLSGMFREQGPVHKRRMALRALRCLCQGTGYVVRPLTDQPELLMALVEEIRTQTAGAFRREVLTTFGVLGAVDPATHQEQQMLSSKAAEKADFSEVTFTSVNFTAEFFSDTGVRALLKILEDTNSPVLQKTALQALLTIMQSLGARKAVSYLESVIPLMFNIIDHAHRDVRDFAIQQLCALVQQTGMHIREFVPAMFERVVRLWQSHSFPASVALVKELAHAFEEEFGAYLPLIFPHMVDTLAGGSASQRQLVLGLVSELAYNLTEYEYFVVPPVVAILGDASNESKLRCAATRTLMRLARYVDCSRFTPRIVRAVLQLVEDGGGEGERELAVEALTGFARVLGEPFRYFIPMVDSVLRKHGLNAPRYNVAVADSLSRRQRPESVMAKMEEEGAGGGGAPAVEAARVAVNIQNLSAAWSTQQLSTPQDWLQWHRRFAVMLLVESPSPVFRACQSVAQLHYPLALQLFNISFASCWKALPSESREPLVQSLIGALRAPTIPSEILQALLHLAEFMELEDNLPIDKRTLGELALRSQAYAKALRYAEDEYRREPEANVEKMIGIYSELQMPRAAVGLLAHAKKHYGVEMVDDSWYEKLQRWEEALQVYERHAREEPEVLAHTMGRVRCLHRLNEWEQNLELIGRLWERRAALSPADVAELAPRATAAAYHTGRWQLMQMYVEHIDARSEDGAFYRAINAVFEGDYGAALRCIETSRARCDEELTALVAESYTRAYSSIVRLQQLVELEEIVDHLSSQQPPGARERLMRKWSMRFKSVQQDPFYMQRVLGVRSVLLSDLEQHEAWLKYAHICSKKGRLRTTLRTLRRLLGGQDFRASDAYLDFAVPEVAYGAIKYLWLAGNRARAMEHLEALTSRVEGRRELLARLFLKLARWRRAQREELSLVAESCRQAVQCDDSRYKAWHLWSLANFELIKHHEQEGLLEQTTRGFFRAIELAAGEQGFQDVLRLLTLWFSYGDRAGVERCLREGFRRVKIDTWIRVIPQLIARIHTPNAAIRRLVHTLLMDIGQVHPQALVYPLMVAAKSKTSARRNAASAVIARVKQHSPLLIEQATMVGTELIAASVVLHERWMEALDDAAAHFYTNDDIPAMLRRLTPLHAEMRACKFETRHQVSFHNEYGADLQEAHGLCENYRASGDVSDLNEAWEGYARVYHKLKKKIPKLRKLQLGHVSPTLFAARNLELAVPGTYVPNAPVIRIASFGNGMRVYSTKQRPRKLKISGSDGNQYVFVLKAREDLRLDERVMQFFALTNSLLARAEKTKKLDIEVYPIIPLSPNSGLIGFVPHSDTMHQLISDFRASGNIPLDVEFRYLYERLEKGWPEYQLLTPMQKIDVYRHICANTEGLELAKIMWIRAGNSERWLENRHTFTNSLAVMSMVGYILGLGDRHPNNIVIDRHTGKLIHIDFGDSFESSMHRQKFPETVPFRLTRMLVACMEVAALEGTFVKICERVMHVLRNNQDSISAVMEAFVFDPLFNWRFKGGDDSGGAAADVGSVGDNVVYQLSPDHSDDDSFSSEEEDQVPQNSVSTIPRLSSNDDQHHSGAINDKAIHVVQRITEKLTGTDFHTPQPLSVSHQVQRLIHDAVDERNLAQLFSGWCGWW